MNLTPRTWRELIQEDVSLSYAKERATRVTTIKHDRLLRELKENSKSISSVAVDTFMNTNQTPTGDRDE